MLPSNAAEMNQSAAVQQDRATRQWTFLFYLCGDHGQWSRRIRQNLKDIETIQPSGDLYIAVQHDLANEGAKRFIIADRTVNDADKESLGQINTGDPNTALQFFQWGIEQCPSKHIAIFFGGTGIADPHSIVGNVDTIGDYEQLFAFCDDKTAEDAMNPVELGEIFAALVNDRDGEPIDLVAFDMCSMQYIEIAYQLKTLVRVMIGSQNNERAPEWSYSRLIQGCNELLKSSSNRDHPDTAAEPSGGPSDLVETLKELGHADPNDPRVLGAVVVKVISDSYYRNPRLKPIVSALDLTHLDRVTRSLDTFFLALLRSLGNPVVWEARDRVFIKLVGDFQLKIAGCPELRERDLIAYDLLELLCTLGGKLAEVSGQGGLDFWYREQLKKHCKPSENKLWETAQEKDRREFLEAQQGEASQIDTYIKAFQGNLETQLEHAFAWLFKTQREALQSNQRREPVQTDPLVQSRIHILEAMWNDYHNLDKQQLEENIENAVHLKKVIDEVAELLRPAPRKEATSGKWFVLASEPRRTDGQAEQCCGVLIHRPQHLDRLTYSSYLNLDFHRHVHWVSLLGAINLIRNHPGAMWRLISSLLSTASSGARDDLLRRLVGPDSVISGFGNQFQAMRRPPCVTLSIEKQTREQMDDSTQAIENNSQNVIKRDGYRLVLESSRSGATLAEQFNHVNQKTIDSTLIRLEDLLKRPWITQQEMKTFESLGKTLGEDVIQKLHCQLSEEWQHVLKENPDDVLHLQLQLPLELMRFPWELMHDGEAFLGERYGLGRQLYMPTGMSRAVPRRKQRGIKVLIIGDPKLEGPGRFQQLYAAREEAKEVADQFERLGKELRGALDFVRERDVYIQESVTTHQFRDWLRSGEYDIIHFAGHAEYIKGDRERSAWIFSDGPLWAVEIRNTLAKCTSVPWLIFANACESSMGESVAAGYQSNVFGLATAFINEGVTAYVGPLWPISDSVALQMAKDFYESLLLERDSVGEALRFAKIRAKEATLGDLEPTSFFGTHTGLSWASLILYGDPTMKLMDTIGMSSLGQVNHPSETEEIQHSKRRENQKLMRRRRYSASGLRQRPMQSSVSETQDLLRGPGMDAKILNSQQLGKEIPSGKYALELNEVNGVRYWQFSDGSGYRSLEGSFIKQQLETNNLLRDALGLPPKFHAEPLAPRPIGHWLINRDEGSILNLVRQYDQGKVQTEQFLRIHSNQTTAPLGNAGLRWVNSASEGKLRRVLLILHDTLCDTHGVVSALGDQFIRWACRNYGAVIGFDHWTLSKSPAQNADALWDDLLKKLDDRIKDENSIDILAHGRGGLVARALIENQNAEASDPSQSIKHVVFAGTPNAGSELLRPQAWGQTADILVNMAHVDGTGMYGSLSGLLARMAAIQQFTQGTDGKLFDRQIPGLVALWPQNCLKRGPWPANVEYSGIAAVYEPGKEHNVLGILRESFLNANRPNEIVYSGKNDLMSETKSLWESQNLTSTKNWELLLLDQNLPKQTRQNLGPRESRTLESNQDQHLAGIHRTNMLSLNETQQFLKRRLLGKT